MKYLLFFFTLFLFVFGVMHCKETPIVAKDPVMVETTKKESEPAKKEDTKPEEPKKVGKSTLESSNLPVGAKQYLPLLKDTVEKEWPKLSNKATLAAQVEQETCISLKHARCWNPKAELKTSREYGFGFGQITTSYKQDGSVSIDNFTAIKKLDKRLTGWEWENRYDPKTQMLSLVIYDKYLYNRIPKVDSELDQLAFAFASYNGGLGGTLKDRTLCQSTEGCDPNKWFDNVEKTSYKAKTKVGGYGKSFYEINREYVRNILFNRLVKYIPFM